jgi:hypothetical protein
MSHKVKFGDSSHNFGPPDVEAKGRGKVITVHSLPEVLEILACDIIGNGMPVSTTMMNCREDNVIHVRVPKGLHSVQCSNKKNFLAYRSPFCRFPSLHGRKKP